MPSVGSLTVEIAADIAKLRIYIRAMGSNGQSIRVDEIKPVARKPWARRAKKGKRQMTGRQKYDKGVVWSKRR